MDDSDDEEACPICAEGLVAGRCPAECVADEEAPGGAQSDAPRPEPA
jgi:hypothetical protein